MDDIKRVSSACHCMLVWKAALLKPRYMCFPKAIISQLEMDGVVALLDLLLPVSGCVRTALARLSSLVSLFRFDPEFNSQQGHCFDASFAVYSVCSS